MPTTSNFGWTTPADTDLVKDGAAAIRTLGNGIDTSLVDLKGGTTGQILSKNSNTDLDYIWINNDQGDITAVTAGTGLTGGGTTGAVTLTNDMATTITASGDIVVGTGNGTYDNLPIGTTGQVLTADTTVSPYKVKWATPASAAWTTYTPTWTNLTVGNGTNTGRYYDDGINVQLMVEIIFGSTTSISGTVKFSLPVNASSRQMFLMGGRLLDSGSADCISIVQIESATTAVAYWPNIDEVLSGQNYLTARTISSTVPWTWATNDRIQVYFTYEKA